MQARSLAIIGGGVSGLAMALLAQRTREFDSIVIFEKESKLGGRVYSAQVKQKVFADLGANIIDFENRQQEESIRSFLDNLSEGCKYSEKLRKLSKPFLLFQDGSIRKGDHQKERYFYQGGFEDLVSDLASNLQEGCKIIKDSRVLGLEREVSGWRILGQHNNQNEDCYDSVVLACPAPHILTILQNSLKYDSKAFQQLLQPISYTKQISIAFEYDSTNEQYFPFSCILFLKHKISFICSHDEKYSENTTKILVIQMNEQFSKLHFGKSIEEIEKLVCFQLPVQVRQWVKGAVAIKHWQTSLVKSKRPASWARAIDQQNGILITGDAINGSSRVSGAIYSSIIMSKWLSNLWKKGHL